MTRQAMTRTMKRTLTLGVAGALAITAATASFAAPVPTSTVAVKDAVASQTIDVRWHRHRGFWPGAIIGGLALGIAGAALAAPYYYDRPGYVYDYPGYYYGSGPGYYDRPAYGYPPGPFYYRHRYW